MPESSSGRRRRSAVFRVAFSVCLSASCVSAFSAVGPTRFRTKGPTVSFPITSCRERSGGQFEASGETKVEQKNLAAGDNFLGKLGDFAVSAVFTSDYYLGSKKLHLAVPLPKDYPSWYPKALKIPKPIYSAADAAVEFGLLQKLQPGQKFRIQYGLLRSVAEVDTQCDACEEAKREAARQAAATDLVNIGPSERQRRTVAGYAPLAASVPLCLWSVQSGPFARYVAFFPALIGLAYIKSGQTGLWNIGQSGMWDVDGTGMEKIEDEALARKLRDKVNAMNKSFSFLIPLQIAFALFPFQTALDSVRNVLGQ